MTTFTILFAGLALGCTSSFLLQYHFPLYDGTSKPYRPKASRSLIYYLPLISASLALLLAWRFLDIAELLILTTGLYLAIYDQRNQSYPLIIWIVGFVLTCCFALPNWVTLLLLSLAYLAQNQIIPIGAGDFLYLASLSLIMVGQQILWIIQLASLLGLLSYFKERRTKTLAFIPYLYAGFIIVLFIEKICH